MLNENSPNLASCFIIPVDSIMKQERSSSARKRSWNVVETRYDLDATVAALPTPRPQHYPFIYERSKIGGNQNAKLSYFVSSTYDYF